MLLTLSIFKNKTRILHHFAFLVWLEVRFFSSPNTPILPLKTHFSIAILPLRATYFVVQEGFIYTITADVYTFHLAFSTILPCILHHFTLHLAPK